MFQSKNGKKPLNNWNKVYKEAKVSTMSNGTSSLMANWVKIQYVGISDELPKMVKSTVSCTAIMNIWADKLDAFLEFNERELLTHADTLQMKVAQKLAANRYDDFDDKRKKTEALAADEEDIKELEALEKT